jgi:pimeloyl-ACP methyl ester carboxylesterase
MQTVYFISGLGANRRTFNFLDLSFCKPVFVDWIEPLKHESLPNYAARLMKGIPEKEPVIVGLSLGGMLATEMAKLNPRAKVIIISSNKTSLEFPSYLRLGLYLPLYRWSGKQTQQRYKFLYLWIFGARGEKSKALLKSIMAESNPQLTMRFIDMILRWKNKTVPPNVTHIHGTDDKLLPYRKVKADYTIKGGTHLMIMNNADEISALLKNLVVQHTTPRNYIEV